MKWIFCVFIFFPPTTCFEGYTVYIDSTMVERMVCSISFWNIGFEFLCNAQKPPETRNEPRLIIYYICSQESIATRECRNLLFWVHVLAKQFGMNRNLWACPTNMIIHHESLHLLFIRDINFRVYSCEIEIFICTSN